MVSASSWEKASFFQELESAFGWKLLILIFACQHLGRGMSDTMHVKATPWLYKAYNIPAPKGQVFSAIAKSPFALRPLLAMASDACPIVGYNKTPYMLVVSFLGSCASAAIAMMPHDAAITMMPHAASLRFGEVLVALFLITLQISVCDVLSEAKYAESVRKSPANGPMMAGYVWGGLELSIMLGVLCGGLLIQFYSVRAVYCILTIPLVIAFIVVACGYVEERKQRRGEILQARERFIAQPEVMMFTLYLFAAACIFLRVGLSGDTTAACATSFILCIILICFACLFFTPLIAKIIIFAALQRAFALKTSIAAFYFYSDRPRMYPAGPHFSAFFVFSIMGIAGAAFSWIGVLGYMRFFSSWRSRRLILFAGTLACSLHLLDAVLFSRANLRLGIPDEFFVLSSIGLESAAETWMWMPIMVMFAHICPKGMEATMYATILGARYLGSTAGDSFGALLLEKLGCTPSGAHDEGDTFENLWIASLVACFLPMVIQLVICPLIPDVPQDVSVIAGSTLDTVTQNSLWRTMCCSMSSCCRRCSSLSSLFCCCSRSNVDGPQSSNDFDYEK
jgi:MFS family permease